VFLLCAICDLNILSSTLVDSQCPLACIPGDLVFQWFTYDLHSVPVLMLTTIIGGSRSLNPVSCSQFGVLHVSLLSGLQLNWSYVVLLCYSPVFQLRIDLFGLLLEHNSIGCITKKPSNTYRLCAVAH
jgi:hypothetical protein